MKDKEQDKVLVVVKTDAVIDPHAMMVKLFNTYVAHGAVLRSSRFRDIASVTPCKSIEDELVVAVAFYSAFQIRLGH